MLTVQYYSQNPQQEYQPWVFYSDINNECMTLFVSKQGFGRIYLIPCPNATNLASKAPHSTETHWNSEFLFCV